MPSPNSLLATEPGTLEFIVDRVKEGVINPFLKFLIPLAIAVFMVGVLRFIINSSSEEGVTTGKRHIVWSLVGFVIMLLVFVIINLIQSIFYPELHP